MGTELEGPRRLVLLNLLKQSASLSSPTPDVLPGQVRFESNSLPGLTPKDTYTATFTQNLRFPGAPNPGTLVSSKTFQVSGSPYTLDPSLVHSVYPPSGHADYWSKWLQNHRRMMTAVSASCCCITAHFLVRCIATRTIRQCTDTMASSWNQCRPYDPVARPSGLHRRRADPSTGSDYVHE